MGTVYRAVHVPSNRVVALKVFASEATQQSSVENIPLTRLRHANVIRVHEQGRTARRHFLAMDLVKGTTCADWVAQRGPLSIEQAVAWCRQTALGLRHLHNHGFVHRDVKPENMIIDADLVLKIIDLDTAMYQPSQRGMLSTVSIGTPPYAAPEQYRADGQIDVRADIYALGCTLHFFLTGQHLARDSWDAETVRVTNNTRRPCRLDRRCHSVVPSHPFWPGWLKRLLAEMMAPSPDDRPSSMNVVLARLSEWDDDPREVGSVRSVGPRIASLPDVPFVAPVSLPKG